MPALIGSNRGRAAWRGCAVAYAGHAYLPSWYARSVNRGNGVLVFCRTATLQGWRRWHL
jgi:hypothetical protein